MPSDPITRHAELIQRLASQEEVDYDDLKQIYKLAQAIILARRDETSEAAFLATCGPATHDFGDEVMEANC